MAPDQIPPTRTASPPDPATDATRTTPPGDAVVFAGRYRVVRPLGEGGMGSVFLAHDTQLDREVAIKVLPGDRVASDDSVKRFRREAMALAKLTHPGIVQAHDVGEHDGRPFLVMEYVAGENLSDRLKRAGALSPARAADVGHQVAAALAYAHAQGLIHRDVKPGNLILTADGRVKLLDLGLARFVQDHLADPAKTREGAGMGTPDYSAPEQFRDARLADARSDVYALGCTLYHLIGGRVPFPGSSLSEKLTAHETQEPAPVEELAPEAPLGLALAVRKMMAKKPRDRFQSAREAADALAPFVAGGASTVSVFARTAVWDGSRLGTSVRRPASRVATAVVGLLAGVVLAVLAGGLAVRAGWVKVGGQPEVAERPEPPPAPQPVPAPVLEEAPPPRVSLGEAADPNVLTVSQKAEGGGTYRTIGAALEAARPGQTVRVLDDATYAEQVQVTRPTDLRGVTLDSPRGATIAPKGVSTAVVILNVPGVTVRGFRLRAEQLHMFHVGIGGRAAGVTLEQLELTVGQAGVARGVTVEGLALADDEPPVVIRGCRFRDVALAVRVAATDARDGPIGSQPCRRVCIRDNVFENPEFGAIALVGDVRRVQVVGNRVTGATRAAVLLESLADGASDVLIANNSFTDCKVGVRVAADAGKPVHGDRVRVRNNLFVRTPADILSVDNGGDPRLIVERGEGDGAALAAKWSIGHNGRDPAAKPSKGRVPAAPTDVPAAGAALATKGAGAVDPSLPWYVGAVPPPGTPAWDWDRAFRMPADAQLLTVSQKPEGGGKYRTINDALKDAKPWTTVRVLDDAVYPERVALNRVDAHAGVTLEAVRGAVLAPTNSSVNILVRSVPNVTVRGFRVRGETDNGHLIVVSGNATGTNLHSLDLSLGQTAFGFGINLELLDLADGDSPVVVRNCRFRGLSVAVRISGTGASYHTSHAANRIHVLDNVIENTSYFGIIAYADVRHVQIVGNRIYGRGGAGIVLSDLRDEATDVLIANNTVAVHDIGLLFRDDAGRVRGSKVRVTSNLFLQSRRADVLAVDSGSDWAGEKGEGDGKRVAQRRTFSGNWRDTPPAKPTAGWVPLGLKDVVKETIDGIDRDPKSPTFLRPAKDSPLAAGGAGATDPRFPKYVGAVPPEGVEPWDWDRTWRWTMAGPPPADDPKKPEKSP